MNGELNAHTKIPFICPTHGEYWQLIANHYNKNTGCPKCGDDSASVKRRKYNPVLNAKDLGEFICDIHGVYLQSYDKHYNVGHGCPICAHSVSSQEISLREFVESLGVTISTNNRKVIYPNEVDIFIPEKNVAIEYNGNYWHSELHKTHTYHLNKYKACKNVGIRLIQVWEHEWYNERKQPIMKSIIKSALNIYETKLNARKCKMFIYRANDPRVVEFFEKNHLSGHRHGQLAFCLEYNNEIVQSAILSKSTFFKNNPPYEIIRSATKINTQVRGGLSKLLKCIIKYLKSIEVNKLIYYIELDHFNGKWFENNTSICHLEKIQPTIKEWYVNDNIVKNRNSYKYKEFLKLREAGIVYLLYTAGTAKYVFDI